MDVQVGRVWDAVRKWEAETGEDWLIIITTDHGLDAETGKEHGGQTDRECATWIVTNSTDLNDHFGDTTGVVDVLPSISPQPLKISWMAYPSLMIKRINR